MKQERKEGVTCYKRCRELGVSCPNEDCRHFIDYEKELNCVFNSIYYNGDMTLKQVSERLKTSITEVGKVEKGVLARGRKLFCREQEFSILKNYL